MQHDFIMPGGKLPIPEAETIIPAVNTLRRFIFANGYSLAGSMDCHKHSDEEISDKPDFKDTFPLHCEMTTPGASRVGDLGDEPELFIPKEVISDEELSDITNTNPLNVMFHKEHFDVFTNPNIDKFLDLVKPHKIVVYGVALDICVKFAVEGFLKRGDAQILVVTDCVKALDESSRGDLFKEWNEKGVLLINSNDIESKL